jgi:hypothetical protein
MRRSCSFPNNVERSPLPPFSNGVFLLEGRNAGKLRLSLPQRNQGDTEAAHPVALLRARRERPRGCRAANSRRLMSDMGACSPRFVPRPWLYRWFAAIQGITERMTGPWATPEMF